MNADELKSVMIGMKNFEYLDYKNYGLMKLPESVRSLKITIEMEKKLKCFYRNISLIVSLFASSQRSTIQERWKV